MVLRHDRQTGATSPSMSAGGTVAGYTAGDVGRALRRARTRQGLSVKDVSARTGLPVAQLRAAETGALDVPNQLSTLKAVRRYADFLGLPGDRFALAILEHWPTNAPPSRTGGVADPTAVVQRRPGSFATAAGPGPTSHGGGPAGPPTATLPVVGRSGAPADPSASITRLPAAGWPTADDGPHGTYAFQDTGVTPAVRVPEERQVWRAPRRRSQALLRGLVWVVALAVIAGLAALVVDWVRPSVFRSVGPPHPTTATTAAAGAGATATTAAQPAASPTTAAPPPAHATAHKGSSHKAAGHAVTQTRPTATSPTTASMTVGSAPFVVKVAAVGGDAWVQVTSPTASAPLFSGIVNPGQSKSFTVSRSAVVEVGSSAGRMSVSAKSKVVLSTYQPPGAPYTVTFQAAGR